MDRKGINQALTLGKSRLTNSIIPESFRVLLAAAGRRYTIRRKRSSCWPRRAIPNGFDAGEFYVDASYSNVAEALLNNFAEVGIRTPPAAARTRRLLQGLWRQEA